MSVLSVDSMSAVVVRHVRWSIHFESCIIQVQSKDRDKKFDRVKVEDFGWSDPPLFYFMFCQEVLSKEET